MRKLIGLLVLGAIAVVAVSETACSGSSSNCDAYCSCSETTKAFCNVKKPEEAECKKLLDQARFAGACGGLADAGGGS